MTTAVLLATCLGARMEGVDFALLEQRTQWLCHPVYGDASFDSFVRREGNPVSVGCT